MEAWVNTVPFFLYFKTVFIYGLQKRLVESRPLFNRKQPSKSAHMVSNLGFYAYITCANETTIDRPKRTDDLFRPEFNHDVTEKIKCGVYKYMKATTEACRLHIPDVLL